MRTLMLTLAALCLAVCVSAADDPMLIHEWGTFTSLRNMSGITLGINADDEARRSSKRCTLA